MNNFAKNRRNLVNKVEDADYILIAGNGSLQRSGDTAFKFRQDSNIIYFTGINDVPFLCLLIDVKHSKHYLVKPKKSKTEEIFEGQPDWVRLVEISGVDGVMPEADALRSLKNKKVYFNVAAKPLNFGVYTNPNRAKWQNKLSRLKAEVIDIRPIIAEMRQIKQQYEIDSIQRAITITNEVLDSVEKNISSFKTENQIINYITAEFSMQGVEHAYQPIVASGKNASVLHYLGSDKQLSNDTVLLIDVGAEYNGYSADISRTIIVGRNKQLESLVRDIKNVQADVVSHIKPGLTFKDIQAETKKQLAKLITNHSIGNENDIDKMFPHSFGHHLGLDTHDVANYQDSLEPGMVITVEPGIYSSSLGFGIRIEDDVLITEHGAEVL